MAIEIETTRVRGWRVAMYSSPEQGFVTAQVVDDDVHVFVDFDAEFGFDWRDRANPAMAVAAKKLAMSRMHEKIDAIVEARRKKFSRR